MYGKPKGYKQIIVNDIKEVVTNADAQNQSENYALASRGLRVAKQGMVMERDYGTQMIYPSDKYPLSPIPEELDQSVTLRGPVRKLFDPVTGYTHNIIAGVDNNDPKMARFYVDANNGDNATPDWEDLTRVIRGTVFQLGATFVDVLSDSLTENLTDTVALANDECNGWVILNYTAHTYSKAVENVADNGSGLVRITITGHGLTTGKAVYITGIQGATGADGFFVVTRINDNAFDLDGSTFGGSYTSGGTVERWTGRAYLINDTVDNTTTVRFTLAGVTHTDNLKYWQVDDVVYLFRSRALLNRYTVGNYGAGLVLGSDFLTDTTEVEAQRKMNFYLRKKDANGIYQGQTPLRIQNCAERERFFSAADTPIATFPAGWYMEEPVHSTFFGKIGTIEEPEAGTSEYVYVTNDGSDASTGNLDNLSHWLTIRATLTNEGALYYRDTGKIHYIRGYIVPVYDSYQLGDPITEFFVKTDNASYSPKIQFDFYISPGKMNQHITGLAVYAQLITDLEYDATASGGNTSGRTFFDADVRLVKTIHFDQLNNSDGGAVTLAAVGASFSWDNVIKIDWDLSSKQGNWQTNTITIPPLWTPGGEIPGRTFSITTLQTSALPSIVSALGHAVVKERTAIAPRYGVRASRHQGALTVIDIDDATLAVSGFSGDAPMDDVFPQVETDNAGFRQRIFLQSRGKLIGVKFIVLQYPAQNPASYVVALKPREIEVVSLQGGGQWIIPADIASQDSIVQHPKGIAWAGESGIYEFSYNGQIEIINRLTVNEWDGSKRTDDGTKSITESSHRAAAVGGYCEFRREMLLMVQQNVSTSTTEYVLKRFNIDTRRWESERKISTGLNVAFISSRPDKLVDIVVTSTNVLKYPVVGKYEDEITFAGSSQSKGFESSIYFNVGSLYSYNPITELEDFSIDYHGTVVSGTPTFGVYFYANDETNHFDQKTLLVAGTQRTIRLKYRGGLKRLRIKIVLAQASAHLVKELDINTLNLGVVVKERTGTQ